jgi:hypothetical protein
LKFVSLSARWLLLLYALLNAVLYSLLLPLWEGFDEPFHFGYVQTIANGDGFPDPGVTRLSAEIGESIEIAPMSISAQQQYSRRNDLPGLFRLAGIPAPASA